MGGIRLKGMVPLEAQLNAAGHSSGMIIAACWVGMNELDGLGSNWHDLLHLAEEDLRPMDGSEDPKTLIVLETGQVLSNWLLASS